MRDPIVVQLSPRERVLVDDMRARVGLRSDADLVRTALFRLAEFLDVPVDWRDFALAGERPRARK